MRWNHDSGLVFEETVAHHCDCLPRAYQSPTPPGLASHKGPGVRKLSDICEHKLLTNFDRLGTDSLAGVPSSLVNRLWSLAVKHKYVNLRRWQVFARTGLLSSPNNRYMWEYQCQQCRRLLDVLKILDEPSQKWLTKLTLDLRYMEQADLFQLSRLRNLRSLSILDHGQKAVTDRVMLSWAEAAGRDGAFRSLRCLSISLPRKTNRSTNGHFTKLSLRQLQYFPSLRHICITGQSSTLADMPTTPNEHFGAFAVSRLDTCSFSSIAADTRSAVIEAYIGCSEATERPIHSKVCLDRIAPGRDQTVLKNDHDAVQLRTAKKRKLKNGKSQPLDDMLQ
ncbi:hypothetical protein LTR62_003399 [Meristemomyces frigidus]|uniref:Uncharacterized protein n=1 Tax=Meristemomyces frigidus TaxID=1508187 RepID=A0AAN7TIZ0_9PEZI|nr:hypothetical protein LTR62_003399 [Meristemomyces frigidus]